MVKFKNKKETEPISAIRWRKKSMVAVSFITSLYLYKPSPFTFLDEIEAAFDKKI